MVGRKKLKTLFFSVVIVTIIVAVSLFFISNKTEQKVTEKTPIGCNVVRLFNGFISGESPSSLKKYCKRYFSEDDCRIYFYGFILSEVKKGNFEVLKPDSPYLEVFTSYLTNYQPQIMENMDIDIGQHFKSQVPIEDPNNDYVGLNAGITRNSTYCELKGGETEKMACINEVRFLKATNIEDCDEIDRTHLRLLCFNDLSQEEYTKEISKCNI